MKLHAVFMVEAPHDFNLLDKTLLALVLRVGSFFGKRLYCKIFASLNFFSEVDRREVALSDLLFGLELLMKPTLIELDLENIPTSLQIASRLEEEFHPVRFSLLFAC